MSVTLRITRDLWMTFDGVGLYRFIASGLLIVTAAGIAFAARWTNRPGLLIGLVWAWTVAGLVLAATPWSADWWWHRVLIATGTLIAGRALGMRVQRAAHLEG